LRLLVNALMSAEEPSREETPELVYLSCPSCAASLEVDGKSRITGFNYCGNDVYLPDSVWRKFHPAGRKRRCFLICEYTDEDPEA